MYSKQILFVLFYMLYCVIVTCALRTFKIQWTLSSLNIIYHPIYTAIQSHEMYLKVLTKKVLVNNSNYLNKVVLTQFIVLFTFF